MVTALIDYLIVCSYFIDEPIGCSRSNWTGS